MFMTATIHIYIPTHYFLFFKFCVWSECYLPIFLSPARYNICIDSQELSDPAIGADEYHSILALELIRNTQCDEQKPACANCIKHSIQCEFTPVTPQGPNSENDTQDGALLPKLVMRDLELLHHFVTVTCMTITNHRGAETDEVWRVHVVKDALSHDWLMRGVLALAALHLSRSRPERAEYFLLQSTTYQTVALAGFRSAMTNLTEENCNAVFAFSCMVAIHSFASPRKQGALGLTATGDEHGAAQWVHCVRGTFELVKWAWKWLEKGYMMPLFRTTDAANPADLEADVSNRLASLLRLCDGHSPEVAKIYEETIHCLRRTFVNVHSITDDTRVTVAVLKWPIIVPQSYMIFLDQRHPEALVILSNFCVLLNRIKTCWWIEGWPRHIMETIHGALAPDWRSWIDWPMHIILPEVSTAGIKTEPYQPHSAPLRVDSLLQHSNNQSSHSPHTPHPMLPRDT
jgi:Fungal specific transcription factor domain/Fungal Zn(2)-Cys(6) binuclear cluster domain